MLSNLNNIKNNITIHRNKSNKLISRCELLLQSNKNKNQNQIENILINIFEYLNDLILDKTNILLYINRISKLRVDMEIFVKFNTQINFIYYHGKQYNLHEVYLEDSNDINLDYEDILRSLNEMKEIRGLDSDSSKLLRNALSDFILQVNISFSFPSLFTNLLIYLFIYLVYTMERIR